MPDMTPGDAHYPCTGNTTPKHNLKRPHGYDDEKATDQHTATTDPVHSLKRPTGKRGKKRIMKGLSPREVEAQQRAEQFKMEQIVKGK